MTALGLAQPDPDSLTLIRELANQPEGSWVIPSMDELSHITLDSWQGEHTRLFVVPAKAPPFASAYRENTMGGVSAHAVETIFKREGLVLPKDFPADYLGFLLEGTAVLLEQDNIQSASQFWEELIHPWIEKFNRDLYSHAKYKFYHQLSVQLNALNQIWQ